MTEHADQPARQSCSTGEETDDRPSEGRHRGRRKSRLRRAAVIISVMVGAVVGTVMTAVHVLAPAAGYMWGRYVIDCETTVTIPLSQLPADDHRWADIHDYIDRNQLTYTDWEQSYITECE